MAAKKESLLGTEAVGSVTEKPEVLQDNAPKLGQTMEPAEYTLSDRLSKMEVELSASKDELDNLAPEDSQYDVINAEVAYLTQYVESLRNRAG